jgi:hypothetical protein
MEEFTITYYAIDPSVSFSSEWPVIAHECRWPPGKAVVSVMFWVTARDGRDG